MNYFIILVIGDDLIQSILFIYAYNRQTFYKQ